VLYCLNSALHWAAAKGYYIVLSNLISEGFKTLEEPLVWLNDIDFGGNSALHCAAEGGHVLCCKLLIQSGIDVGMKNYRGLDAMDLCRKAKYNSLAFTI